MPNYDGTGPRGNSIGRGQKKGLGRNRQQRQSLPEENNVPGPRGPRGGNTKPRQGRGQTWRRRQAGA